MSIQQVFLIRHGETEWSLNGRHTGVTDLPLTENGRKLARQLAPTLAKEAFGRVFTSPMQRARETCELAGLGARAEIDPNLMEWNYGHYEGLTSKEIEAKAPGWVLFRDGCPGGESPEDISRRVDAVIERVRATQSDVALFAHGHVFRVLAVRWIGLPAVAGGHFFLDTATLSVLSYYRGIPAIQRWNAAVALQGL